ncbi:MAG: zf-HC2 domain-containing protein [Chloroflexota bacterium]
MISHDRAQFLISDSLDAPLALADQQALAAHLAGCPGCRRFADQMGAAVARIHAIPQLPASAVVTRGVLERIDDGPPSFAWLRRGGLLLGSPAVAAAGAAALVAALAGTIYLAVSPGMNPDAEPRATISAVAVAPEDATATAAPSVVAAPSIPPTAVPTEAPAIAAAPPSPTPAPAPTRAPEVVVTIAPQPAATATAVPRPTEPPRPTATAEPAVRRAAPGEATRPPQPAVAAAPPAPTEAPQIAMAQEAPPAVDAAPDVAPVGAPVAGDVPVGGAEPVYDQPAVRRENDRKDQGAAASGGGAGNDGRDRNRGNGGNDGNNRGGNRGNDGNGANGGNGGGNRDDAAAAGGGGAAADAATDPVAALVEENLGVDRAYDPAAAPLEEATPEPAVDPAADTAWTGEAAPTYDENGQPIIVPAGGDMPVEQVIEPVPGEGDAPVAADPAYDPALPGDGQVIEPVQPEGGQLVEEQAVPQEQPAEPAAAVPASDIGSAPVIGAGAPGFDPAIAPDGSVLTVAPNEETGAPTAAWVDPASGLPVPFEPTTEGHVDTPVGWAAGIAYYQRLFDDGRVELRAGTPGGGGFLLWSGQDGGPFGSGLGSARLTPGGDRIAFLANGGLFVAPTADPNAGVQVPVGAVVGYDWSPAGDRLAVSDGYTVSVFDAYGNGPLIAVGNQGGIPIGAIDWRDDGIAVARFDTGEMILFPI